MECKPVLLLSACSLSTAAHLVQGGSSFVLLRGTANYLVVYTNQKCLIKLGCSVFTVHTSENFAYVSSPLPSLLPFLLLSPSLSSLPFLLSLLPPQKQLGNHPHIVNYVASAGCPPSQTSHGSAEFLIQTELCNGEHLHSSLSPLPIT